jgi:hypothetical protein
MPLRTGTSTFEFTFGVLLGNKKTVASTVLIVFYRMFFPCELSSFVIPGFNPITTVLIFVESNSKYD